MEIDQQKLTAALLVDNLLIANYQKQALINAIELLDIKIIINCQNTLRKKNSLKQFLLYFLNLFSIKNYMSKILCFQLLNFLPLFYNCFNSPSGSLKLDWKLKEICLTNRYNITFPNLNKWFF